MNVPAHMSVWEKVAERACQYPYGVGRTQIARDFGVLKSTAQWHLETAVKRGLLRKFYGWVTKSQRGWIYINPESAPEFDFMLDCDTEESTEG